MKEFLYGHKSAFEIKIVNLDIFVSIYSLPGHTNYFPYHNISVFLTAVYKYYFIYEHNLPVCCYKVGL